MKSPSVGGWKRLGGQIDFKAEWLRFVKDLSSLQRADCFSSRANTTALTQSVAESIPIPADESLLFFYVFSREGYVDLRPGMQLRIDKTLVKETSGTQTMKSVEADYEVKLSRVGDVELTLSRQRNRHLAKQLGSDATLLFDLPSRIEGRSMLRLLLESIDKNNFKRNPMLIAANDIESIEDATREIESSHIDGCGKKGTTKATCITLGPSSTSLLISCWIGGKRVYKPFGTTVGQVLGENPQALKTSSLRRLVTGGGYANIDYPKTLEAARQIILNNGDRLAWKN